MFLSDRILGSPATRALRDRSTTPVLIIGRDVFTRGGLASVECFNYHAAIRLNATIATLEVRDTRDLFMRYGPSAFAVRGIGVFCLAACSPNRKPSPRASA